MVTIKSEGQRTSTMVEETGRSFVDESRHTRIVRGGRVSRMPRHPAKEIKTGTLQSILKDLDLRM
jgi:mRNA interferase HicA